VALSAGRAGVEPRAEGGYTGVVSGTGDGKDTAGLTPGQWEQRLEGAAAEPQRLAEVLEQLDREMRQENTWLHENPEPGGVLRLVLRFLGRDDDDDLVGLGRRIDGELRAERALERRYRGWQSGEEALDRVYPYIKDFPGEVRACADGLQFPGFLKFKGVADTGTVHEAVAVYLNERFPGRDPANFRLCFVKDRGRLIIKRVFRKELPRRRERPSTARAVLIELVDDLCPGRECIRELVVDNAANVATRQRLLLSRDTGEGTVYRLRTDGRVEDTPLGKLMLRLARELGLKPGDFRLRLLPYGILEIRLAVG